MCTYGVCVSEKLQVIKTILTLHVYHFIKLLLDSRYRNTDFD